MGNAFTDWYRKTIRESKYRWLIIVGTLLYLISPIDLLPDVIPIVGQIDDVLILTILVSEVSQILVDRVKSAKTRTTDAVADQTTDSTDSVDVDAIRVD
jgi:uncharacterized membrane protein YkvA (DUF1232 family)